VEDRESGVATESLESIYKDRNIELDIILLRKNKIKINKKR
jgi:hypothetical protein